jgi:iron complex outermembrane receptor protein
MMIGVFYCLIARSQGDVAIFLKDCFASLAMTHKKGEYMKILSLILVSVLFFMNLAQADDTADLGTIVVEASRSNDTVGNMNKDVTIITAEDIANSPAKNLPELLDRVPGVNAKVNSSIKDQQVEMGGFGESSSSNVVVLVDGRRLNTPDLASPDLSLIDMNSIDHIEVIQGAGTVLYGDNATGGVINIITKKGKANTKPSITLNSEIDSYKGNKDGMDISGGLSQLSYQFDYQRQQTDNYRTQDNYWANDYDTHLDYNPTDIFGVDFSQGYHLDRYRLPGGISSSQITSGGPTGVNASSISYGSTSDSHYDLTPHMHFDAGTSNIDLSFFTSARKNITNITYPNFSPASSLNVETESYEFQPKAIVSTPLTDRLDNKLTTGYDYIYYTEKRRINSAGNPEDIVFASEASQSVYLLDELALDNRWLFNTGARGAWADYIFNQVQQTPTKFDRSPTTEGFDGGLGYKYNPDSKVFVDYTRSYRLPKLDEFFQNPFQILGTDFPSSINSGLTYQVGNQYQVGIKDQSIKGLHLGATFTEADYRHEIYDDPNLGNANYGGKTRHYTEEADISVDLFNNKIEPFANVTFQQAEFLKGLYSGSEIPDVPDQLAHAGITYLPLEGLSTTISTDFVGKQFGLGDDVNLYPKVKRHETFDWSAKYDYKNMEVWVSLNNIFDTHYFVYGSSYALVGGYGSEVYYPAPTRNIQAGVKLKF